MLLHSENPHNEDTAFTTPLRKQWPAEVNSVLCEVT